MKKTLFCIALLLLLCTACASFSSQPSLSPSPPAKAVTTDDFLKLYAAYLAQNSMAPMPTGREDMTAEQNNAYFTVADITPEAVRAETGCQVFKTNWDCESYVVYRDRLYHIGMGFGGWGVVDIATCDFDGDGTKDLIYTYSWGSGLHRSLLAVFSLSTMKEQPLDYANMNGDMALEKLSDSRFRVYDATVSPSAELDYSHLALTRGKLLAEVTGEGGKVVVRDDR